MYRSAAAVDPTSTHVHHTDAQTYRTQRSVSHVKTVHTHSPLVSQRCHHNSWRASRAAAFLLPLASLQSYQCVSVSVCAVVRLAMSRRVAAGRLVRPGLVSSLSGTSPVPVRTLWNSCLQPSIARCQCARHALALSPRRFSAPPRPHTAALGSTHFGPAQPSSRARRLFSSPALSSSPSAAPLPGPLTGAVELTDAAARRIGELRARHGPGIFLRLSVDSGGCSGLSYKFEIDKHGQQPDDLSASHNPT